jgi:pimeloyl-ACP methyl ester carboxylesterase
VEDYVTKLPDGRTVGAAVVGPPDGIPVLYCHSLPGCRVPPPWVEPMANKYGTRVIAPDRPGLGLSDFQPDRTLLDWPHDAAAVMESLGHDRYHVLGVSSGGVYVLSCCLAIPERIVAAGIVTGVTPKDEAGIVHVAAPAPIHWAVRHSRRFSHLVHALLIVGMRKRPDKAIDALKKTLSAPDKRVLSTPEGSNFLIEASLESARNGVRGWVYDDWLLNRPWGFAPSDIKPTFPIFLWWGDDDLAIPLEHGQELQKQLEGSRLRVFPGDGHFSAMFERIEEVIIDFLGDSEGLGDESAVALQTGTAESEAHHPVADRADERRS